MDSGGTAESALWCGQTAAWTVAVDRRVSGVAEEPVSLSAVTDARVGCKIDSQDQHGEFQGDGLRVWV